MTKSEEVKLMIIENFIDHHTTKLTDRESMKISAKDYVKEDHVNEIIQSEFGEVLKCIAEDAEKAVDGTWDKSDSGFEAQITLIEGLGIIAE